MGVLCCRQKPIDFDGEVNLFHFSLLRNVGKGAFGKVRVVRHKQTGEMYALKYINKAKCVKMKAVVNIIQERRLLEEIDHPFIVNLRYAFQDDENCFFVLDLMLGGDLRFHLERQGRLSEDAVRFWTAEIASGVAYLHEKKIIHRDIKPDNVLLDVRGHAHLTDFNIAVHFSEGRLVNGVAGSMAYMAPEVLARKGYSCTVDWWSLGVCAYELAFGRRPFRGNTNTELKNAITRDHLSFPADAEEKLSRAGVSALKMLLDRDTTRRLGCKSRGEALEDFRRHPFFASLDWARLESKSPESPFIPDPNKAHFDATYDLEELLLEDNPLRARERKNQDVNKLSAELRQLEEQFTPYDFTTMRRRSYYPQNQIVSSVTATSSSGGGPVASRPTTPAPTNGDDQYPPMPPPAVAGHERYPSSQPPLPQMMQQKKLPSGPIQVVTPAGVEHYR